MSRYAGVYNRLSKAQFAEMVDPADVMKVYRADPTGRYGGKDRMETMPTRISRSDLHEIATTLNRAEALGMPKISSEELLNRVLVEGRGDAGGSGFDRNEKKASALYKALGGDPRLDHTGPGFAATYFNKSAVSKRLGIPLSKAWIGTGISEAGETGDAYAIKSEAHKHAAGDPKNAAVLDYINRAREGKLTPQELAQGEIQGKEKQGLHTNNITDPVKLKQHILESLKSNPNAYSAVESLEPNALQHALHNYYRKATGVPEKPWGAYHVVNENEPQYGPPDPRYPGSFTFNPARYRRATMGERGDTSVITSIPAVQNAFRTITALPEPTEEQPQNISPVGYRPGWAARQVKTGVDDHQYKRGGVVRRIDGIAQRGKTNKRNIER